MRKAACPIVLCLALAACSSTPETTRPTVDRPEVVRPEGAESEGLAEMRNELASRRAANREQENALLVRPDSLSTHSATPWHESLFHSINGVLRFFGF